MAYKTSRLSNGKKNSTKKISTKAVYDIKNEDNDNKKPSQSNKKKKKIVRNENGEKNAIPNIHVNPIEEKGK